MNIITDFFTALTVSVITTVIVFLAKRKRLTASGGAWLFLFMFLCIWAGGIWVTPFGRVTGSLFWMPYAVIGLIMALIFLAVTHQQPPSGRHETLDMLERIEKEKQLEDVTFFSLSAFSVALLVALAAVILLHYMGS